MQKHLVSNLSHVKDLIAENEIIWCRYFSILSVSWGHVLTWKYVNCASSKLQLQSMIHETMKHFCTKNWNDFCAKTEIFFCIEKSNIFFA